MVKTVLMQFRTASMSAMLAITKHGVCLGIIAPCLVTFIMVGMEAVKNWISARKDNDDYNTDEDIFLFTTDSGPKVNLIAIMSGGLHFP